MGRIHDATASLIVWAVGWYNRPPFKKWLLLENNKDKIFQAIAKKEEDFPDLVISFVAIALSIPVFILERLRWDLLLYLFLAYLPKLSLDAELPILKPQVSDKPIKKPAWDYDGRTWHLYSHIIAQRYGWDLDKIAKLEVKEAMALVQEILTDEQLDREFLWSMSDKSYIYNYQTKSGRPNPLDRPYWMVEKAKGPTIVTMPKSMLPMGVVDYSAVGEYAPKEITKPKTNMEGL